MTQVDSHVIDLYRAAADVRCPKGSVITEHDGGGSWTFSAENIVLFSPKIGRKTVEVSCCSFRSVMKNQVAMNANVLDFLLSHPELIPQKWKYRKVLFLGTVYGNFGLYFRSVRYLIWNGGRWESRHRMLHDMWTKKYQAAVFKAA